MIEDNGLKKMQALCAVMRKLLHAVYAILKHRKRFDDSKFYVSSKPQSEATAS